MEVDFTPNGGGNLTSTSDNHHYGDQHIDHHHSNATLNCKNITLMTNISEHFEQTSSEQKLQTEQSSLKRFNSEPMINELGNSQMQESSSGSEHSFMPIEGNSGGNSCRVRRFSASTMSLPHSPTIRTPSRIQQIRHEETGRLNQEVAHERETQSTMQMSQSWEEKFSLDDGIVKRRRSFSETLHIIPPPLTPLNCSPSPSRVGKQCFSPSMHQAVKNNSLTPSPSPSPTRKTFTTRRSLSPIVALRPSSLSLKRKLDTEERDSPLAPAKKFHHSSSTPDRPVAPHPLAHSMLLGGSTSSVDEYSSPEHTVPSSLISSMSGTSTPTSYTFKPVDTMATDSEASDLTETTVDSSDNQSESSSHVSSSFNSAGAPNEGSFTLRQMSV